MCSPVAASSRVLRSVDVRVSQTTFHRTPADVARLRDVPTVTLVQRKSHDGKSESENHERERLHGDQDGSSKGLILVPFGEGSGKDGTEGLVGFPVEC